MDDKECACQGWISEEEICPHARLLGRECAAPEGHECMFKGNVDGTEVRVQGIHL